MDRPMAINPPDLVHVDNWKQPGDEIHPHLWNANVTTNVNYNSRKKVGLNKADGNAKVVPITFYPGMPDMGYCAYNTRCSQDQSVRRRAQPYPLSYGDRPINIDNTIPRSSVVNVSYNPPASYQHNATVGSTWYTGQATKTIAEGPMDYRLGTNLNNYVPDTRHVTDRDERRIMFAYNTPIVNSTLDNNGNWANPVLVSSTVHTSHIGGSKSHLEYGYISLGTTSCVPRRKVTVITPQLGTTNPTSLVIQWYIQHQCVTRELYQQLLGTMEWKHLILELIIWIHIWMEEELPYPARIQWQVSHYSG